MTVVECTLPMFKTSQKFSLPIVVWQNQILLGLMLLLLEYNTGALPFFYRASGKAPSWTHSKNWAACLKKIRKRTGSMSSSMTRFLSDMFISNQSIHTHNSQGLQKIKLKLGKRKLVFIRTCAWARQYRRRIARSCVRNSPNSNELLPGSPSDLLFQSSQSIICALVFAYSFMQSLPRGAHK